MSIQLFIPTFRKEEILKEVSECLDMGWTGIGYKTQMFENAFSEYTGFRNCHFISSNTVGLHLALEVFKREYAWSDTTEILTTPMTFVSTNSVILQANLVPNFCDVDETLCMSPKSLLDRINNNSKAVIYVGIGGNASNYNEIRKICDEKGLLLILDAAHMAGTKLLNDTHIGLDSDVAVFSFQAVKNLPTADSGMICFKNSEFDVLARKLSWLGINKDTFSRSKSSGDYKWYYEVDDLGYKYNGNSIMASLAIVGLKYLDEDNKFRRELSKIYRESILVSGDVSLIEHSEEYVSSRHLFQLNVSNRDDLLNYLNENSIFPGVHYRNNLDYSIFSKYDFGQCPTAKRLSDRIISLPLHMRLKEVDVIQISNLINDYYQSK